MKNIFSAEEKVISEAEAILASNTFHSEKEAEVYRALLEKYKALLRQMTKIVKIADITQLELKNAFKKLDELSHIDSLTGLYNRRHFNEVYAKEWNSTIRNKTKLSLIMVDIDYFKKYNDNYGHLQGDECLKAVAEVIKSAVRRPRDLVARFGGEEFVVLLPETDINGATFIGKYILALVRKMNIEHVASPWQKIVTVSLGIATKSPEENLTKEEFINNSDKALYLAKDSGRNCYKIYCDSIISTA
ncbi:GGDEF domain-containing protein [Candidatus Contubernalis alkaliaceticus]|uniref:GGDEF domain-containing protein n=1 Tax=Candidatus Contubernalis alkaliaceticus TaxID=338645 RepID=UPI001F4C4B18|nr:diguanylate cyclase [Candidatus Contubernalis alkalaceticus]UNC90810.1 GGDEF domain-containing protein [Candidatus Contubernalis alkalaceticus]